MINWKQIADDDFIAHEGEYTLRVEKMDKKRWWAQVYFKDDGLIITHPRLTTDLFAKLYAENVYLRHKYENHKTE